MKVAALYDIHGNLPALCAVLEEVAVERPALVIVGGDVVAGPMPEATLDALFASGFIMRWVMGNADRAVIDLGPETGVAGDGATIAQWTAGRLRDDQLQLLETFAPSVMTGGVLFCHGSPRSDTEFLTPLTDPARLLAACEQVRQRVVVCGHSHRQFDRQANGHRVVNAGSIGRPFEGDAAAFWLLIEDGVPHLRRTAYDVDDAIDEMRDTGMPALDAGYLDESLVAPGDPDAISRRLETVA